MKQAKDKDVKAWQSITREETKQIMSSSSYVNYISLV